MPRGMRSTIIIVSLIEPQHQRHLHPAPQEHAARELQCCYDIITLYTCTAATVVADLGAAKLALLIDSPRNSTS